MRDVEAHPLTWPHGQKRTPAGERKDANFYVQTGNNWPNNRARVTLSVARNGVMRELELMGATAEGVVTISSNIPLRGDGLPRADYVRRRIEDPGVAVYFFRAGRPIVVACDQYTRVEDNLRAVEKTLEAMRGIERWGSREMMDQAFVGFTALPAPAKERTWREVFGLRSTDRSTRDSLLSRYRELAQKHHPDRGGDPAKMAELNRARDQALEEIG